MSTRVLLGLASACASLALLVAPARAADPVIAAAGDIACDTTSEFFNGGLGTEGHCQQRATSDLLVAGGLSAVLPLGDTQYHVGSLSDYEASFHPSWGRVKPIIRPIPGNHEYSTSNARGYFDYFNGPGKQKGPAGDRDEGYYSFNLGSWHLIGLNSICDQLDRGKAANGCAAGSPQENWLRADLASHRTTCTLAYFHDPLFNSGFRGNSPAARALWNALYEGGADVVLSADAHSYERFSPQAPDGRLDLERGIRQFVVGTGGAFFTGWSKLKPNSEVRQNHTFGVLMVALRAGAYVWRFAPVTGQAFTDSGSGVCHGRPASFKAPPPLAKKAPVRGPCTIRGTDEDDRLYGTRRRDVICGLDGDDVIRGLAGNDVLRGGDGIDRIRGGKGRDRIYGGRGDDRLSGQSGRDRLVGNSGKDRLHGSAGNDSLSSRDRRQLDRVVGGKGRDRAKVDRRDRVRSVERVFRR
ncbi:MAG: metallophosphoesterase [Solirubrobacterales bacterium]